MQVELYTAVNMDTIFYRRNLPHWQPLNCQFFVTFRLANSLPVAVLDKLASDRECEEQEIRKQFSGQRQTEELYRIHKKYFGRYDSWLDQCLPESPRWLSQEPIAHSVVDELRRLDRERYHLMAFCIMPNHVHLLIDTGGFVQVGRSQHNGPTRSYPLSDTLRILKGRTARTCNLLLDRSGAFWQGESYDHVVRDQSEYEKILLYILNNPVKAGLVSEWQEYRFNFVAIGE